MYLFLLTSKWVHLLSVCAVHSERVSCWTCSAVLKGCLIAHLLRFTRYTPPFHHPSPPAQILGRKWEPGHRCLRCQSTVLRFLLLLWKTSRRHMKTKRWPWPQNSSSRRAAWTAAQGCLAFVGWVLPKSAVKQFRRLRHLFERTARKPQRARLMLPFCLVALND